MPLLASQPAHQIEDKVQYTLTWYSSFNVVTDENSIPIAYKLVWETMQSHPISCLVPHAPCPMPHLLMLWESLVPQMMASRLSVLCHLHSIMIHIIMGSLGQRMRLFHRSHDWHWVWHPRLFAWGGFWQTVSYELMVLCRDIYAWSDLLTGRSM